MTTKVMKSILCVCACTCVYVSVIVSQWTSMLRIVALHLEKMGMRFAVIDGTVNIKKRMDLVEEFNTNPRGPEVCPHTHTHTHTLTHRNERCTYMHTHTP